MTDSERPNPVDRISGILANVDAESGKLKDSIGEIIVRKQEHSNGAPTIEGTGIRVKDVAGAYEHSGYDPDEITELYPELSLADVHYALGYYYEHINEFR